MGVSKGLVCLWSPKGDSLGLSGFFNKGKGNLMGGGEVNLISAILLKTIK